MAGNALTRRPTGQVWVSQQRFNRETGITTQMVGRSDPTLTQDHRVGINLKHLRFRVKPAGIGSV